jgi:transcriptional regulator with XRE-family HTH domain
MDPHSTLMKGVHTIIHEYRLKKNYTQAALAASIGVCLRHYRDLEQGKRPFTFEQILVLREVLEIEPEVLLPPYPIPSSSSSKNKSPTNYPIPDIPPTQAHEQIEKILAHGPVVVLSDCVVTIQSKP